MNDVREGDAGLGLVGGVAANARVDGDLGESVMFYLLAYLACITV